MYLIDTNIFLEVMLNQKNSDVVKGFFNRATFLQLFVSDFMLICRQYCDNTLRVAINFWNFKDENFYKLKE